MALGQGGLAVVGACWPSGKSAVGPGSADGASDDNMPALMSSGCKFIVSLAALCQTTNGLR